MLSIRFNQRESFNIAIRKTRFRGFQLYFENEQATDSMLRAIDDFPSFFTPGGTSPLIIDCGANIGVSVLEWKYRWPMSRVICFEPDPFAFELLKTNIDRNDLPGVECVQAALADFDGRASLHGDLGRGADARGNSLRRSWGSREETESIEVRCTRLAPYLAREPVAFLKIDIEGAEEAVLRDSSTELRSVDAAYVEVHETDELLDTNSLRCIERILIEAEFQIEVESRFGPHALPAHLQGWQRQVGAKQTQLLCWRNTD
jgi:FkbM family methyltransferase